MARNIFGKSRLTRKKNSYLSALVGLLTSQSQTDPTLDLGLRIKEIMLWYERILFVIYSFFSTPVKFIYCQSVCPCSNSLFVRIASEYL
jgi:hypothetical protein